jgi:hypothetical protein
MLQSARFELQLRHDAMQQHCVSQIYIVSAQFHHAWGSLGDVGWAHQTHHPELRGLWTLSNAFYHSDHSVMICCVLSTFIYFYLMNLMPLDWMPLRLL